MGNQYIDAKDAVSDNRLPIFTDPVTVTYADGSTTVAGATRIYMGTIPAYSLVLKAYARIATGFNASGNDYLTIGTSTDDDLLVNDLDISTGAAAIPSVVSSTTLPYYTAVDLVVYATYVYSSTAPSAGSLEACLEWVPWWLKDVRETL
jgi:hypothetical protein